MSITGAGGNCTSGYSVTDNAGTDGLSTAKHCSDNDDYFEYYGDTFDEDGGGNGGAIDLMWGANSGYTSVNKIQTSSSGNWRRVTATEHRNNQVIGTTVRKYGRSTHYTCGRLISKTYNTTHRQVRKLGANLSDPGDSGGPWFKDNTACGIHQGSVAVRDSNGNPTGDRDAIYMAVNYFSHLGIDVITD